jgi:hypothetical protein
MKHHISVLLGLLLVVGFAACQSPTPEATPTRPEPTATAAAAPTSPPEDTPTPTKEPAAGRPAPTPTTPWQIPEVQPDDWAKGGTDAGLILVYYSDFQ